MIKIAGIVAVSLFASGLCIAPFAMAAPVKEKRVKSCNKAASQMDTDERGDFLTECLSVEPPKAEGTK